MQSSLKTLATSSAEMRVCDRLASAALTGGIWIVAILSLLFGLALATVQTPLAEGQAVRGVSGTSHGRFCQSRILLTCNGLNVTPQRFGATYLVPTHTGLVRP